MGNIKRRGWKSKERTCGGTRKQKKEGRKDIAQSSYRATDLHRQLCMLHSRFSWLIPCKSLHLTQYTSFKFYSLAWLLQLSHHSAVTGYSMYNTCAHERGSTHRTVQSYLIACQSQAKLKARRNPHERLMLACLLARKHEYRMSDYRHSS